MCNAAAVRYTSVILARHIPRPLPAVPPKRSTQILSCKAVTTYPPKLSGDWREIRIRRRPRTGSSKPPVAQPLAAGNSRGTGTPIPGSRIAARWGDRVGRRPCDGCLCRTFAANASRSLLAPGSHSARRAVCPRAGPSRFGNRLLKVGVCNSSPSSKFAPRIHSARRIVLRDWRTYGAACDPSRDNSLAAAGRERGFL